MRTITRAAGGSTSYVYDNNGNMKQGDGKALTYNAFNLPLTVSRSGSTSTFSYGADLQRYKQVLNNSSGTETTHYIGKATEVVIKGSSTTTKVFIDDIAIVNKTQISGQSTASYATRYTLRDRLGSVVSLTDEANQLSEHRSYDPFGKPRKGDYRQWNPATLTGVVGGTPFTSRGFTDHEHLDDAELIHMNGRVYDYNLGRFYSVDPVIQAPGNSQSLNPYSYIMNNPLAGTDPTGYTAECVEAEKCHDQPKRAHRSGRGFAQEVYQVYQRPNNGADRRTERSETSDIGSQGDSDNTMQRKDYSETYKETKGTGIDMDASQTKATLDSIPDSIKYVKSFIEMLESKEGAWFDKVVENYGYDNAGDFEDTRLSLVADSLKVIGRMEYFMANPNNFYYVLHPEIDGDATHYMMHSRVGFGKPFFDGDSRYKAAVMIHEMSHTVFAGNDGDWNTQHASGRLQQLSQSAREGNSTQAAQARRELRTNAYLYEFSVMGDH